MQTLLSFFSLFTLMISFNTMAAINIGDMAPTLKLQDGQGNIYNLAEAVGKHPVVLEWYNHGCPFVKKHYSVGNMQALQKKYKDKGVKWFSVISSAKGKQGHQTPSSLANLYKQQRKQGEAPAHRDKMLLDTDGRLGQLYGAKTTPHIFLIAKNGKVAYQGAIDSIESYKSEDIPKATNYLDKALESLLAGKKIQMAKSKPYGCSVKY